MELEAWQKVWNIILIKSKWIYWLNAIIHKRTAWALLIKKQKTPMKLIQVTTIWPHRLLRVWGVDARNCTEADGSADFSLLSLWSSPSVLLTFCNRFCSSVHWEGVRAHCFLWWWCFLFSQDWWRRAGGADDFETRTTAWSPCESQDGNNESPSSSQKNPKLEFRRCRASLSNIKDE